MRHKGLVLFYYKMAGSAKSDFFAFVGTDGHSRIISWLQKLDIHPSQAVLLNGNHKLFKRALKVEGAKIVALNASASKKLEELKIEHFKLFKPKKLRLRGQHRLNFEQDLEDCRIWIHKLGPNNGDKRET